MTAHVKRETRIGNLFDFLAEHPDGVTIGQIAVELGTSVMNARYIVQGLRDALGDDDTINLPCDPDPANPKGPWLYRLVGTYDGIERWSTNRILDTERRLQTQLAMVTSVANGAKANTIEGRKARIMRKALTRLLEDLEEIKPEGGSLN